MIVDATFLHRRVRDRFHALARELDVPFVILDCRVGPDELRRRLRAREQTGADASDADVAVMEAQQASLQPLSGRELDSLVEVGPGAPVETLWTRLQALCAL